MLTDRVAIVTGAAMGIGRAIAEAFAAFGAGLALCDRDGDELEAAAESVRGRGRGALTGVFDVRDPDAVSAFLRDVDREYGRVDVLVNNAGGTFQADYLDVSRNAQDALVAENFTSATHFIRGSVPLVPDRGGSIVNVTSIEAHRAGPGFAVYSAMKAALASLTKSLAVELGDRRIRVNCIAPDLIPTPGVGEIDVDAPLARKGHVDDVAAAAVFLASDLSAFVTGSTIHVDGGTLAASGWHRDGDEGFVTS